jgi:hypothetical protein
MLHGRSFSFFTSSLKYLFRMFFRARFFEALKRFNRERHYPASTLEVAASLPRQMVA